MMGEGMDGRINFLFYDSTRRSLLLLPHFLRKHQKRRGEKCLQKTIEKWHRSVKKISRPNLKFFLQILFKKKKKKNFDNNNNK
jgi:hypothetical protein